jgi:cob(I)alamin adenosyltransferase
MNCLRNALVTTSNSLFWLSEDIAALNNNHANSILHCVEQTLERLSQLIYGYAFWLHRCIHQ